MIFPPPSQRAVARPPAYPDFLTGYPDFWTGRVRRPALQALLIVGLGSLHFWLLLFVDLPPSIIYLAVIFVIPAFISLYFNRGLLMHVIIVPWLSLVYFVVIILNFLVAVHLEVRSALMALD